MVISQSGYVRCEQCVIKKCDVRKPAKKKKQSGEKTVYKLVILWIITSCLLASTSTYLAFRCHLDASLIALTGNVLSRVNSFLYVSTWLCFFTGILGPILVAFVCVSLRPAFSVAITSIAFCCLVIPCVTLYTEVFIQVMRSMNVTSIQQLSSTGNLKVSPELTSILEQEMWMSLNNFTWNGNDDVSKAWDDVHLELQCCGVSGPDDWRSKRSAAGWICDDVVPEKCYKQYFERRKRLFDCKHIHNGGCFPKAMRIIEAALKHAFLRIFLAIIVMGAWTVLSISCALIWFYLRLKHAKPQQARRKSLSVPSAATMATLSIEES
ncbi:hypothetical protein CAPTEDRAFT_185314 [Capitella teleta]|uniref:Tetraspanin n=1 Tax=Capitella teleta TaxID=283909 RepID=R7VC72_CAPTE|nr:hypothetical protein CAPTEDRAFT_185314 [Capitella teleta]|eukprot:ELU13916.1 hypothetical protein CAPTEDRAFT_185314 [Capitella teleta]